MPLGFLMIFILWILYRFLIKKDLKQNLNSLYTGFLFVVVWAAIYYLWVR